MQLTTYFLADFWQVSCFFEPWFFKNNFKKINLFILFTYFWLHWVFVAVRGLSLVVASGGYSSLQCGLLIVVASLVAEHGL